MILKRQDHEPPLATSEWGWRYHHLAFEVDDLEFELSRQNFIILTPPNSPGEGTRVAMIEHNGVPIELIEFERKANSL